MDDVRQRLSRMKLGIIFALLTLFYGFGLGAAFGAFEGGIKGHLKGKGQAVLSSAYEGDEAAMKKVTDKSWVYIKRAHLHANGLGTTALTLILLVALVAEQKTAGLVASLFLGFGALGYSVFWMLAGLRAPGLGSTHAAKESLKWLALPSSALCALGLLLAAGVVVTAFSSSARQPE